MDEKFHSDQRDDVLLLQLTINRGWPGSGHRGSHYLVFVASKSDLLDRNFTRVKAFVQEQMTLKKMNGKTFSQE